MLYDSLITGTARGTSCLPHRVRTFFLILAFACVCASADEPLATVCEVLAHPEAYSGKPVVVVGRFSFREYGRFLSEKDCVLRVLLDAKTGPVPAANFAVDNDAAGRKLAAVRKSTSLAAFRFGSSDYDRWAMIYGRVEPAPPPEKHGGREFEAASSQVLCHSQTLLIFLHEQ